MAEEVAEGPEGAAARIFTAAELAAAGVASAPSICVAVRREGGGDEVPWLRQDRIGFTEIEVVSGEDGRPAVRLYGRARARADALGVHDVMLSLSHTEEFACAFAIAVGGASDDSDQPGSSP